MRRWFILLFAFVLPMQFAWVGASAYCQHETSEVQSMHIGHHFHAHQGEAKKSSESKLMADADCASCQASAATAILIEFEGSAFEAPLWMAQVAVTSPYSSAFARAPDRPQWRRLV